MRHLKSCGVILFRREPELSFLLMKHPDRWDLPKGHVDEGETELECALREMEEETGIPRSAVRIDDKFRFSEVYYPVDQRYPVEKIEKTLIHLFGLAGHAAIHHPHRTHRPRLDPLEPAARHPEKHDQPAARRSGTVFFFA